MSARRLVTLRFYSEPSSFISEGSFSVSFILSLPLSRHCKQPLIPFELFHRWFFFSSSTSLMILVMARRYKKNEALTDPQCNRAFIFQVANPRSSLSPLFGESAPKAKHPSQFTRRPIRHYFVQTCHDLTIINIHPLHNHQGHIISRRDEGQNTPGAQTEAHAFTPPYLFIRFHLHIYFPLPPFLEDALIQKE